MPLRLSKPPDPRDPDYQSLEKRVNLALHIGIWAASNSCMWFVRIITESNWEWSVWVTSLWAVAILGHGIWVFTTITNQATPNLDLDLEGESES